MGFLQPWLLLALPLALIPIVIHFVNQWRYQTKPWAAMMFLLRAQTMHRGLNRIRQWIILAMRAAVVCGIILAASRPIASGLVGWLSGGNVDAVLVLMDCSPSMLTAGLSPGSTKQETAIKQLEQSLSLFNSSKWILLDSNSMEPSEFDSASHLLQSPKMQIGDALCNWPALLDAAISYLERERPTQAQLWIISDLQESNFDPGAQRWQSIRDRLIALQGSTRIASIEYPEPPITNYAIRLTDTRLQTSSSSQASLTPTSTEQNSGRLDSGLEQSPSRITSIQRTSTDLVLSFVVEDLSPAPMLRDTPNHIIPVTIDWQEVKTQVNVEIVAGRGEIKDHRINTGNNTVRTWGRIQLPPDGNLADNEDFFAADELPESKSLVVTENEQNLLPLILAARSPADPIYASQVEVVSINNFRASQLEEVAFLVWQGALPTDITAKDIRQFIKRGGSFWIFPPEQTVAQAVKAVGEVDTPLSQPLGDKNSFEDLEWLGWKIFPKPISPSEWKTDEGLFRATKSGATLEVGNIQIKKLAELSGNVRSIISDTSGQSLAAELEMPEGTATIWKTLPLTGFSNIGFDSFEENSDSSKGQANIVLYVAVQRAIESGLKGLCRTVSLIATCSYANSSGRTDGGFEAETNQWQPVLTTSRFFSERLLEHAGIFQAGSKLIAIHRPPQEDDPKTLSEADWNRLFDQVPIKRWSEDTGNTRNLQSEAWRGLIVLMIVALVVEAAMSLPSKKIKLQKNL